MKRTLLAAIITLATTTATAGEVNPYVGIFGAVDLHDKALYENTSSYNGVSIGMTYDMNESFFIRAEAAGTEDSANPNIGLGYRSGGFRLTGGVGAGQERAKYNFGGQFPQASATDKYTFTFIEAEYKGGFIRYQTFPASFNFTSSYAVYDHHGNFLENIATSKTVSENRSVVQIGYRYNF